jgi:hypothetical protein
MDPVDALNQIAFRLERSGAETYKVRAFRHASHAISSLTPEELAALAQAGRLQRIEGVGKSTAQVIAEALEGKTPAYLAKLQDVPDDLVLDGPATWVASTSSSPTTAPASPSPTASTRSGCGNSSRSWPSSTRSWRPSAS